MIAGEGESSASAERMVKVALRNPSRELEVKGPLSAKSLLEKLEVNRESVLVIVDGVLVTGDSKIPVGSSVEIRPVISGGSE